MCIGEEKVDTVGKFIEQILQTDVEGVRGWLDIFIANYNGISKKDDSRGKHQPREVYCSLALTPDTVCSIADIFSSQISFAIRNQPRRIADRLVVLGHQLLQEIHAKALQAGVETKIEDIDWIFVPPKGV